MSTLFFVRKCSIAPKQELGWVGTASASEGKAGTPTDNAIIEALTGWIKEESCFDFGLETADNVLELLDECVYYFNNRRPAAALDDKSPVQYKTELGF